MVCLVAFRTTNDKHIQNHAMSPIDHHKEAIARHKQINNQCNRWRPVQKMASLNQDDSSLKKFQTNIICTYMLPDKAIFGAFGPKNT